MDEEGKEDVYKMQIQELYKFKHKKVKDNIVEKVLVRLEGRAKKPACSPLTDILAVLIHTASGRACPLVPIFP
jgi:hypothetical protein